MDNFLLENQTYFQSKTVKLINEFLETQEKPICLVAHNGNRFDYPILRTEIHRTGGTLSDDILCIDSLEAFRELHKQTIEEQAQILQETSVTSSTSIPPEFQDGYDELLCSIVDDMEEQNGSGGASKKTVEEIKKINETTPQKCRISVRKDLYADTSSDSANKTVFKKLNFG